MAAMGFKTDASGAAEQRTNMPIIMNFGYIGTERPAKPPKATRWIFAN
jgi:hypothetical protein